MTTVAEAREAVYERWQAQWAPVPECPTVFADNDPFEAPTDGTRWSALSVRHTASAQRTLGAPGNRVFERKAVVFVQLFTELHEGAKAADDLAKAAADIFEGTSFSGLEFQAASVREGRVDGRWWNVTVTVPFSYYETK